MCINSMLLLHTCSKLIDLFCYAFQVFFRIESHFGSFLLCQKKDCCAINKVFSFDNLNYTSYENREDNGLDQNKFHLEKSINIRTIVIHKMLTIHSLKN